MARSAVSVDHFSTAARLAAEEKAMNLKATQRNLAFNGFVGTLAVAVISVICITLGGCTSHATAAADDVPILSAKAVPAAPSRREPPPVEYEGSITPMETVGASPMN
jgi:hypothetical protein